MARPTTRRHFLQTAVTAGASVGLGEWGKLLPLSPATTNEAKVTPDLVRFSPDIEPIVRLIEETPREKCVAMMIGQLRKGLPYRNFLAGLYLANIRTGMVDHPLTVFHSTNQLKGSGAKVVAASLTLRVGVSTRSNHFFPRPMIRWMAMPAARLTARSESF